MATPATAGLRTLDPEETIRTPGASNLSRLF